MNSLKKNDPYVYQALTAEAVRQHDQLQMIPSENYCSQAVLDAAGSIFMNKYAEGYPYKRYYQGNEYADAVELLAIERAKKLFGAEHVNVQPHSGSPANMAAYFALLQPGDTVLAMELSHGGHLTHGCPVNFSGQLYTFVSYGVDPQTGLIDYNIIADIAQREKPKLIISGFTAYPRVVNFVKMHEIAQSVGAYSMADISHIAGLIAGGVHESPFPFTDVVTTTTHKTLRGPRSACIMCKKEYAKKIDRAVFPGLQGGPHVNTIAAKAVAFQEALSPDFTRYAQQIISNAQVVADRLLEHDIALVSGGTDTHLLLIDLIRTPCVGQPGQGKKIAQALECAGIVANANTIPFDPSTPFKPSGIRLGVPAVTTRGMQENEMVLIADWIAQVLHNYDNPDVLALIKKSVAQLCDQFSRF